MILVVGGIKGGSGKTTLATNLVVLRSRKKKVLLIDADEQRSCSDWVDQRIALNKECKWTTIQLCGKSIYLDIQKLSKDYDDIIVDAGGHDSYSQRSCLTVADVFLIPFRPKSLDIWTLNSVKHLITEVSVINPKMKNYAVINQADSVGNDNEDTRKAIEEFKQVECLGTCIKYRKAFSSASAQGLCVEEYRPFDKKATDEMKCVYNEIY
jgi:chromosome partitioning protein